ncbi:MAG: phosphomannomutase/phosphoglucomutase [Planctomycetota bacterium]
MAGIFKAYDIRGVYPETLNEETARRIGAAAALVLKARTVVVGRDMRVSSPAIVEALTEGFTNAGVDVIRIGLSSTPMLYFAVGHWKAGGGVMVTASHNPAQYNGFKFCRAEAVPVSYDTGLAEIEKRVSSGRMSSSKRKGSVEEQEIGPDYRAHLLKFADGIKPLTVAIDTGNGVMGAFLPPLLDKLPCEVIRLYFEPDGTFPHHEANPLKPENMADLVAKVRETKADLGIAFDGDGDRAFFCDETGAIVPADFVTALLAAEMLAREPGGTIVYDLRSSRIVREEILRLGGVPVESRVGHSYMKAVMREQNSLFGGELSGHFYFRDIFTTDNAELAALHILTQMSRTGKKLSALVKPFKKYFASGETNFEVADKDRKLAALKARYANAKRSELDGLTLCYADWWCNVRPSNTEPVLRLNLEARTAKLLREKLKEVSALLRA